MKDILLKAIKAIFKMDTESLDYLQDDGCDVSGYIYPPEKESIIDNIVTGILSSNGIEFKGADFIYFSKDGKDDLEAPAKVVLNFVFLDVRVKCRKIFKLGDYLMKLTYTKGNIASPIYTFHSTYKKVLEDINGDIALSDVFVRDAYHPHMNNGNPCLGSHQNNIGNCIRVYNFIGFLGSMQRYLNSYYGRSVYSEAWMYDARHAYLNPEFLEKCPTLLSLRNRENERGVNSWETEVKPFLNDPHHSNKDRANLPSARKKEYNRLPISRLIFEESRCQYYCSDADKHLLISPYLGNLIAKNVYCADYYTILFYLQDKYDLDDMNSLAVLEYLIRILEPEIEKIVIKENGAWCRKYENYYIDMRRCSNLIRHYKKPDVYNDEIHRMFCPDDSSGRRELIQSNKTTYISLPECKGFSDLLQDYSSIRSSFSNAREATQKWLDFIPILSNHVFPKIDYSEISTWQEFLHVILKITMEVADSIDISSVKITKIEKLIEEYENVRSNYLSANINIIQLELKKELRRLRDYEINYPDTSDESDKTSFRFISQD